LEPITKLLRVIEKKVSLKEFEWILTKSDLDLKGIALAFVAAPRFISKTIIFIDLSEIVTGWKPHQLSLDQLVRIYFIALLGEKAELEDSYVKQIELLFDTAEMNETVALCAAFPIFKYPERWQLRATDAVRSNIGPVFDAIAFGNPFAFLHFSEKAWNQMVLKCIFNDKPIHHIYGLDKRANQALSNTLSDFVHERWAAKRRVPSQIWRLMILFTSPDLAKDLEILLSSDNERDILAAKLVIHQSESPLLIELKNIYDNAHFKLDWHELELPEPIYTA
jgi:hypothetical protein